MKLLELWHLELVTTLQSMPAALLLHRLLGELSDKEIEWVCAAEL